VKPPPRQPVGQANNWSTVVVPVKTLAGSRDKGCEDVVVQDQSLSPQVTLHLRVLAFTLYCHHGILSMAHNPG
jgi:hypothetical protein